MNLLRNKSSYAFAIIYQFINGLWNSTRRFHIDICPNSIIKYDGRNSSMGSCNTSRVYIGDQYPQMFQEKSKGYMMVYMNCKHEYI